MIRLPRNDERLTILGHTGSGKTVAGLWHLSLQNFRRFPWIIIDYKRDEAIKKLPAAEIDDVGSFKSGLYVYRPLPGEEEEVEAFLWKVWKRGTVGLFIDEGYMLKSSVAFNAILMQGRGKRIPVITISQRPVWLPRAVWSEADHFQVYHLSDMRDWKTVSNFVPMDTQPDLPSYHSIYYTVKTRSLAIAAPVPSASQSRNKILDKTGRLVFL